MAPYGSDALYFDVHHDGVFVLNPLRYEHGLIYDWKMYKDNKIYYKTLCEFLKEKIDHAGFTALYFCLPECNLEVGLKIIERDSNVVAMYDFADSYGKLDMFMSHIHQNLAQFYFQNLDMEESGDEATSKLRIHEIMVKDASNMSYDELVSWAEEKAKMQTPKKKVVEHVVDDVDIPLMNLVESPKLKRKLLSRNGPSPIAKRKLMGKVTSPTSVVVNKVKKVVDKGKGKMVEEDYLVCIPVRRNNGIVIEDDVNQSVENDTDSESDHAQGINYSLYSDNDSDSEYSDKSMDYLSEGKDELIELRKRKTEAKNAPKVGDRFVDIQQLKDYLTYYALANGFSLCFEKVQVHCGPNQCRNAKRQALNEGETTIKDLYGYIRSYAKAILESNPGSTVKVGVTVNPDDKTYFDRFYVCFKRLKDAWKLGCRKIIALDGCFLKRPGVGEILIAIGRDVNNHIFPMAWAVVNVENKDNWSWLVEDYVLDCYRKQAFYDTYHQYLAPVGGITFWPECSNMSKVLSPKPRTMPGRPRKKRTRLAHENKNPNKVSKAGVTMTCTNCHQK
nr:pentatricopeptide repeat-containing protein [Tanacetum cinerariifolium]